MPLESFNVGWLDHNANRAYPVTEDSTRQDVTNTIRLPDSFLVDLRLPVSVALNASIERFYIRTVSVFPTGYNLTVAYNAGGVPVDVATCSINRSSHEVGKTYKLLGMGDYRDSEGFVQVGRLEEIDELGGAYAFDPQDATLEPDCIVPELRGISALYVENAGATSAAIRDDIVLRAGRNFRISVIEVSGQQTVIQLDAIDGEGTAEPCPCVGDEEAPPIRTINSVSADEDANFTLLGDNCNEWTPIQFGLRLVEQCAQPCCGPSELIAIVEQLQALMQQIPTLQNFVTRLGSSVDTTRDVILASRVGGGTAECQTCD